MRDKLTLRTTTVQMLIVLIKFILSVTVFSQAAAKRVEWIAEEGSARRRAAPKPDPLSSFPPSGARILGMSRLSPQEVQELKQAKEWLLNFLGPLSAIRNSLWIIPPPP
jgi:hypothetical protein